MPKQLPPDKSDKVIILQDFINQRRQPCPSVPQNFDQQMHEIKRLRQQGDIVGAINVGIQAYKLAPQSYDLCVELGSLLGEQEHYDKALHYLKRAVTIDPHQAEAHLFLGFVYYELGHYRHAIKSLQNCLNIDDTSYQVHATIADCWRMLGDPAMAIAILEETLNTIHQNDESLNLLGVLYLETEQTDRAIATLRQALSLNPQNPAVCTNLGVAYLHRGFIDMGVKYFDRATHLVADDDDALYNLAHALALRGDYRQAKEPALKSLQFADTLRNRLLLCHILIALQEWDEVEQYLDHDYETSTKMERSALCMVRGKCAMQRREFAEAGEQFDLAAQLNPNNPDCPFQAAFAYIATGELNKAYRRTKKAISINDQIAGFWILRGDLEYNLGKKMPAEQSWHEALNLEETAEPDVVKRLQGHVPALKT